eukprot:365510-Chlamydomonas_euryale.AAC.10
MLFGNSGEYFQESPAGAVPHSVMDDQKDAYPACSSTPAVCLLFLVLGSIGYVLVDDGYEVRAYLWLLCWYAFFVFDTVSMTVPRLRGPTAARRSDSGLRLVLRPQSGRLPCTKGPWSRSGPFRNVLSGRGVLLRGGTVTRSDRDTVTQRGGWVGEALTAPRVGLGRHHATHAAGGSARRLAM